MILPLLTKLFETLKIKKEVLSQRIQNESFFTVDMMEYLIKKGVSYREAHDIIGKIVKECLDKGGKIADLDKQQLKNYSNKLDIDIKKLLNPQTSVTIKKSFGSTSPSSIKKQINHWEKILHA